VVSVVKGMLGYLVSVVTQPISVKQGNTDVLSMLHVFIWDQENIHVR